MVGAVPEIARERRRRLRLPGDDRRERRSSPISLPETSDRRVLYMENLGFAAANNAGAARLDSGSAAVPEPRYRAHRGTLELLVASMRNRPEVGLLAVRQVTGDGRLWPSLHRFPSLRRALAQALASERWPGSASGSVSASLIRTATRADGPFDWTTGAALAVRREAFEAVGGFDERFFLFSEETDLCKRIQDLGWKAHLEPGITFVHHAGKAGVHPAREAQMAYARLQYARKHFTRPGAAAYHAILVVPPPVAVRGTALPRSHAIVKRAGLGAGAQRAARQVRDAPVRARERRVAAALASSRSASPRPSSVGTGDGLDHGHALRQARPARRWSDLPGGRRARHGGWIVTPNLDILRQFTISPESRELILAASSSGCGWPADRVGLAAGRDAGAGEGPWQRPRPEHAARQRRCRVVGVPAWG